MVAGAGRPAAASVSQIESALHASLPSPLLCWTCHCITMVHIFFCAKNKCMQQSLALHTYERGATTHHIFPDVLCRAPARELPARASSWARYSSISSGLALGSAYAHRRLQELLLLNLMCWSSISLSHLTGEAHQCKYLITRRHLY